MNKSKRTKMNEEIPKFFNNCKNSIDELSEQFGTLEEIINILQKAQKNGNTIFTIGNGGSGSTASHFVSDLLKTTITKEEKRFAAISLVDNIPVNLAWSNDQSFDSISFYGTFKVSFGRGYTDLAFGNIFKARFEINKF